MTLPSAKLFQRIAIAISGAVALFIGFIVLIGGQAPKRDRYLIPENFAGWLCVSYKVPGAAALPTEDGFRLVKFPSSGVVETSDEGLPGKYKDEFYYFSSDGKRSHFPNGEMGGGHTEANENSPDRFTMKFWVSRDAQVDYPKYVEDKPNACGPFPGYPG